MPMSSSSAAPSSEKQSPFDVIIITSPDDGAAHAVRELIVSSCGDFPPSSPSSADDRSGDAGAASALQSADGTLFISSCDPYGARMGSGGGTVAALAEADDAYRRRRHSMRDDDATPDEARARPTVLICHAGGESSRCPTQIVLGKAWTSLPVLRRTELPSDGGDVRSISSTAVSNPTALLISSLSNLFGDVPAGSVVVAASDVLLSFDDDGASSDESTGGRINFDGAREGDGRGRVIGLAVPAPLSTAKNHGVFVLNSTSSQHEDEKGWRMEPTCRVLQKPSSSEMAGMKNPACAFRRREGGPGRNSGGAGRPDDELCAWIDTGVVAFLPNAAGTLRELSRTALRCCTKSGLGELYEEQHPANGAAGEEEGPKRLKLEPSVASNPSASAAPSLEEFARSTAPKICLYGDMLHALRTSSTATSKRDDPPGTSLLELLSQKLSEHDLYTCAIPTGSFVHLGTTCELVDFITLGASDAKDNCSDDAIVQDNADELNQCFGRSMGLIRRSDSFVSGFQSQKTNDSVVLNSVLISKSSEDSIIGKGSVLEHCHLECAGKIRVGERCLLSGIRGSVKGSCFEVPHDICLQLLPLRQSWKLTGKTANGTKEASHSFVCLCFGIEDGIKNAPPRTLFGLDLQYILDKSGLVEDDIWDASISSSKRMLWNANINPVLSLNGNTELDFSFLDWIGCLKSSDRKGSDSLTPAAILGLKHWREATRLSLSEIRRRVDSAAEARYRSSISSKAFEDKRLSEEVSEILINRRHKSCNFDYVFDFVSSSNCTKGAASICWNLVSNALGALDTVASHALTKGDFDIVGRTFMTMSLLLSETATRWVRLPANFDSSQEDDIDNLDKMTIEESIKESISGLQSSQIPEKAMTSIVSIRNSLLASRGGSFHAEMVGKCCDFLERAASAMRERCISGNAIARKPSLLARTSPIPIGATATASAPARIDLAGGWSDTPPISYEYGGAVACLAVLVDGKRPLKAQCRTVKGGSGIKLRTESRTLSDESLVNSSEVTIRSLGDMADFCNPMAECALLKCALIQLGLVPLDSISGDGSASIQSYLKKFCQTGLDDVGLEITSQSLLPTGSGMGSSSILGGCILSAIAKCVGIELTGMGDAPTEEVEINDSTSLIYAVLMLEQLLTTGGGWQDNIGGLVGGLKLGSSDAGVLPLQTRVRRCVLPPASIEELNRRLVLAFSGKPRLAKNILQNVLLRWAGRTGEIVGTVEGLVDGASEAISHLEVGGLDGLGAVVNRYWRSKVAMAGPDSGVEPDFVRSLLDLLSSEGAIVGGTLCGAGGGGFLAMLASKGKDSGDIEAIVEKAVLDGDELGLDSFTWHSCTVSEDGLVVIVS